MLYCAALFSELEIYYFIILFHNSKEDKMCILYCSGSFTYLSGQTEKLFIIGSNNNEMLLLDVMEGVK